MVRIIPWETECPHCHVRLEYEKTDIKFEVQEYTVYSNVTSKENKYFIICPGCKEKVYLK